MKNSLEALVLGWHHDGVRQVRRRAWSKGVFALRLWRGDRLRELEHSQADQGQDLEDLLQEP